MKKSVVIFIHVLQHYRVPIFELLAERCLLTIVCENADDYSNVELNFSILKCGVKKFGPFLIHEKNPYRIANRFDVVIGLFNMRCLDLLVMAVNPFRQYKFIFWGIGVSASYTKSFDQDGLSAKLRLLLGRFSNALVFYSSYPIERYKTVRPKESLFVANNTIANPYYEPSKVERNRMLFIGTLYKEKRLDLLILAYKSALNTLGEDIFPLDIIGEGAERDFLESMVREAGLCHKVSFHGAIYEQSIITGYYRNAIACISPCQAGLSVLTSMSNAVSFVTVASAITGGEIFSIKNNVTGVILDDIELLPDVLVDINRFPSKYLEMGLNARKFYETDRMPEMMANGLYKAVEYVSC